MIIYLVWAGYYDCGGSPDDDLKFITGNWENACKYEEALSLQAWDWIKITTEEVEV